MEISQQCVVALTWTLKDTLGDDLLARIEEALQGHTVGDTVELHIEPNDAFGDYDDQLIFLEPRALFPESLEEGMTFEGSALPGGTSPDAPRDVLYTVTEIYPDHVVLDGNHPLAGIALRIRLRVHGVRDATEEEIGRGTAGTGFFKVQPQAPGSDLLH
jgi:FKBP-type peptidyl-prolyl cis-trans isomerase SlyD